MPRFVVLYHRIGKKLVRTGKDHFDWMFEDANTLRTYATAPVDSFDRPTEIDAAPLPAHRIEYLDYEGEISGDRGSVERVIGGSYHVIEEGEDRFAADLKWQHDGLTMTTRILIYRTTRVGLRERDNRVWRLRLSSCR